MKKMLKKSDVLREGYLKGLKEARRVINEMIDESPITIDDLVVYTKEAAVFVIGKIEDEPYWQPASSLEDELFVATSNTLEDDYGISTRAGGSYAAWFENMWKQPEIRAVVSQFEKDALAAGYVPGGSYWGCRVDW